MKEEYDLSKMKFRKNPFANRLKKQITLRLQPEVIEFSRRWPGNPKSPTRASSISICLTA
jgi:hypothetical protein